MRIFRIIILAAIAVVWTSILSPAQENGVKGIPGSFQHDWRKIVGELGFTEGDVRRFEQNKFLISNQTFRQVFDPYYNSKIPLFITSDSLLNAYHVLFEETVRWIETGNAGRLPAILTSLLEKLAILNIEYKDEPGLALKARRHANIVLGTALRLLGNERVRFNPDIEKTISTEVGRVVEARKLVLPEWLGPSESGLLYLDYSRFKPRGFYTRSNVLTRYFRAVSWLQAIPFRPHREKELLSILLISTCLQAIDPLPSGRHEDGPVSFFRFYETFVGSVDNWDLDTVSTYFPQNRIVVFPSFDRAEF